MKRTPLRPVSKKNATRIGKLGIVRLRGLALKQLRMDCWLRDLGRCCECHKNVAIDEPRFGWSRMEMAHIHAKRNGGDTLDNVRTLCPNCHRKEHNAGGKPCPPKR